MFSKVGFSFVAACYVCLALAQPADDAAERAVATARAALSRELNDATIDISRLEVVSVKPHTWKNSGLGCSPPRAMTQPVIVEGFIVTFALPNKDQRRVHVAGSRAAVCAPIHVRGAPRIALPPRKQPGESQ